jgi:hypothetical protein
MAEPIPFVTLGDDATRVTKKAFNTTFLKDLKTSENFIFT